MNTERCLHSMGARYARRICFSVLLMVLTFVTGCTFTGLEGMQPLPGNITTVGAGTSSPVLAVAPLSGVAGVPISVAGAGWQPEDLILLKIASVEDADPIEVEVAVAVVDAEGAFSTSFPFPLDAPWRDASAVQVIAVSTRSGTEIAQPFQVLSASIVATKTVTPTITPTATVRATTMPQSEADRVVVLSPGLNVRSGPSTAYAPLTTVARGDSLLVLEKTSNGYWLHVELADGTRGWVAARFTSAGAMAVPAQGPVGTRASTATPTHAPVISGPFTEWRAAYYANRGLRGAPALVRNDASVDFNWGQGSPAAGIGADDFSARWVRSLHFEGDWYRFHVRVDDGVRLYVDNQLLIDGWSDGSARNYTRDHYLGYGEHTVRLEYYEHLGHAEIALRWERIRNDDDDDDDDDDDSFPDWEGEYYRDRDIDDDPRFRRNDRKIDFNWGDDSPDSRIPDDDFAVRWTQRVWFEAGTYVFYARVDDGIRFYIDGVRVLDEWHDNSSDDLYTVERTLDGRYDLAVEYYENEGGARIEFWWRRLAEAATATPTATPTPTGTSVSTATPTASATPSRELQPSANVQPRSGDLPVALTVNGGGFPAATLVNVHLGALVGVNSSEARQQPPNVYASATTDRTGSYSVSFTLPATWDDGSAITEGQILILVATEDFRRQATTSYEYSAAPPATATATPTSTGAAEATPTATPTATSTTVAASPTPIPQPYVRVEPSTVQAGVEIGVEGGGFPAQVQVSAYLGVFDGGIDPSQQAVSFASTLTDEAGAYSMSFVMPENTIDGAPIPPGLLAIVVATSDLELQASATLSYLGAPPIEGSADTSARAPEEEPAELPEEAPTAIPTLQPTAVPVQEATAAPTEPPPPEPAEAPAAPPAAEPEEAATAVPTLEPTATPAPEATAAPTEPAPEEPAEAPTAPPAAEPEDNGGDGAQESESK